METFDAIVIGSGAGLSTLAMPGAQKGLKICLVERGPIGGTCLNRGCAPTKMVIQVAEVMSLLKEAHKFHITPKEDTYTVDSKKVMHEIREWITESREQLKDKIYKLGDRLTLMQGSVQFVEERVLEMDGRRITSQKIFLGVGASPIVPPIQGLDSVPFVTYKEIFDFKELPKSLCIIGGGYIGCELGYFFSEMGTKVHLLEALDSILQSEDDEIKDEFERGFKTKISAHLGVKITLVTHDGKKFRVNFEDKDKNTNSIETDQLLVTTGIKSNAPSLKPEVSGIKLKEDFDIMIDDCLKTSCDGVYAFGDCASKYKFRHSANFEGDYLLRNVLLPKKPTQIPIRYMPVPLAISAYPQVASVGMKETEIKESNIPYIKGTVPYVKTVKGQAMKEKYSLVKALVHRDTRKILGFHIVGEHASILLHEVVAVMSMDQPMDILLQMIHIHPSLNETIRTAFRIVKDQMKEQKIQLPEEILWR